ncbi:hypothetical protein SacmaDRAFT_0625 [Saccharomonospora marina XMU15]|uniref:Uncharacterized protein n=1 Tax=Saccharomonospora marina XMU15 TaxID=882083 RepID=H5X5B4_9PSEU|nr:hypothetical protein [Saccharomonospora marina]EHR48925.1 hypothetical protein SacmaDRAFT_0625 [Saccharomonospora marina XMU15]
MNPHRRPEQVVTVFDIVQQHGPWRVAGFVAALALFLLLHLLRWPLALGARLLLAAQSGLDQRITNAVTPDTNERVRRTAHV